MNKKNSIKMLTEGGMMIALSILLGRIKLYEAPMGGSVTAGSMIPLMLFAIRWGIIPGIAVGATYGLLDFMLKPQFYHPIQFILDYPMAFGLLGLAGLGYFTKNYDAKGYFNLILGIILGIGGRMISHVLSGVVFFAEYAGDKNPWIYSIQYNAYYLIPELIISIVVLALIWKPIKRTIVG
ncbi:energy-coupled thiamine transporter ThiT [Wansuia hejianensis]|uniref:Energy-coupled thiamine transporter ThiT n=1 Tax=Wansuia hejianensis TaxID=2763667 RepID=A0A926EV69_9FIRM|nr:energy-coupled thiamine transporter ThiT [Wansuia hejianensis]MBC8590463.1 energy-coupled thiamine transporter ThiT [Wansuia hejianensis]